MLDAKLRRFRTTFAIQAVLAFATVAGFGLTALPNQKWVALLLGVAVFVAQVALYRTTGDTSVIEFKSDTSDKFVKFFSDWYQRQGDHIVFCKDLDWLDGIPAAQITESLRQQGGRATLIVSSDSANACSVIKSNGSKLVVVPPEIPLKDIKMSLHIGTTGFREIIVQKKPRNAKSVKFIKTTDTILIALAETVIASCLQIDENHS